MDYTEKYREILVSPIRECANYTPKFGHGNRGGFSLDDFQKLYGNDAFYSWLGLDHPLMYAAHKAAGGITSIYRQIGIGCERLVREIFIDQLGLSKEQANWSYTVPSANGKPRPLYLDGRIIFDAVKAPEARKRILDWKTIVSEQLSLSPGIQNAIAGFVFEVRQGYKSKDSKRQNADISNAANAYAKGYIPCLMIMSSQIDDDIVARYRQAKWVILQGYPQLSRYESTYAFFMEVIGFDLAGFLSKNQQYFKAEIHDVLNRLMRAE